MTILIEAQLSDVGQWVDLPAPGRVTPVRGRVRDFSLGSPVGFQTGSLALGGAVVAYTATPTLFTSEFVVPQPVQCERLSCVPFAGGAAARWAIALYEYDLPADTMRFRGVTAEFVGFGAVPNLNRCVPQGGPLLSPITLNAFTQYYAGIWCGGSSPNPSFRGGSTAASVGTAWACSIPVPNYASLMQDLAVAVIGTTTLCPWVAGGLL